VKRDTDLDHSIATSVMGLAVCEGWQLVNGVVLRQCDHAYGTCFPIEAPPAFSADFELAWTVWMRVLTLSPPAQWYWTFEATDTIAIVWRPTNDRPQQVLGPLAWTICTAALSASNYWWRDEEDGILCPACKIRVRVGWNGFHQRQCGC